MGTVGIAVSAAALAVGRRRSTGVGRRAYIRKSQRSSEATMERRRGRREGEVRATFTPDGVFHNNAGHEAT